MKNIRLKLSCYVDESGQDPTSKKFIVASIVITRPDSDQYRNQLQEIEEEVGTHGLKWHKTKLERGLKYLELIMQQEIAKGQTYIGYYKKPTPYFFPMVDTVEHAIRDMAAESPSYLTTVFIDGIDKKKSLELTNALRSHNISLRRVRSARDESEPIIRLADMWAGCARSAALGNRRTKKLIKKAFKEGHIIEATKKPH